MKFAQTGGLINIESIVSTIRFLVRLNLPSGKLFVIIDSHPNLLGRRHKTHHCVRVRLDEREKLLPITFLFTILFLFTLLQVDWYFSRVQRLCSFTFSWLISWIFGYVKLLRWSFCELLICHNRGSNTWVNHFFLELFLTWNMNRWAIISVYSRIYAQATSAFTCEKLIILFPRSFNVERTCLLTVYVFQDSFAHWIFVSLMVSCHINLVNFLLITSPATLFAINTKDILHLLQFFSILFYLFSCNRLFGF